MTRLLILSLLLSVLCFAHCSSDSEPIPEKILPSLYFPPATGTWETTNASDLEWKESAIADLLSFLESNNTRAFILLKDGKIVIEAYFGNTITGTAPFTSTSNWYWASAGKTLTATLVGIAQQEGDLNVSHRSSDYLGDGWTSLPPEKEQLITVENQLTMTTGFEYLVPDLDCTTPECLTYKVDAGDQWYYHNSPYTLLESVVENASGTDYNTYTNEKLESVTGMSGQWITQGSNNLYWSTARDMARFGLLLLNQGQWENTRLIEQSYYDQMIRSSQSLNPSYGYLTWLNGKNSIIYPGLAASFNTSLAPAAPGDLFAALGKNGQFIDVVPSQNLVVVRTGEAPDDGLVPISFHNEMWEHIQRVVQE